jgi:hypothetical protein
MLIHLIKNILVQKKEKQGVGRDGKDFLEDKGRKEAFQRINSFPSKMLVKGIAENGRDELRNAKMFVKELEKGRCIINECVLTV